ncbi:MAG: hypothetical protein IJF83_07540 [Methanobrevibacter sp.]|nr:hypothetical protein [Methanobrevibacter sp.]
MSAFVPPSWFMGMLIYAGYFAVPLIIGVIAWVFFALKDKPTVGTIIFIVCLVVGFAGAHVLWWENFEVQSVQEKIVTVQDWQAKPGLKADERGMMVIDSADDLMMVTSDGEGYLNTEHFLFQKFDTRDILNTLKPNGTYKIKFYGWREGFNSGFPNILSVEEIVDESHAQNKSVGDYFGTKVV